MHVWALGLSCENPGGPTRPGRRARTRQPENSKRAHLSAPALQTPPKFNEKTPRETQKQRNCGGRGRKKARNFGPHPSGPHPSGPPFGAPPFGPHPSGPHPSGPPPFAAPPHPSRAHPSRATPFRAHPSGPHPWGVLPFRTPRVPPFGATPLGVLLSG